MRILRSYHFLTLLSYIIFSCQVSAATLEHDEENLSVRQIYIGVPGSRYPYSYYDKNNNKIGVLIDRINGVCKKAELECNFISGDFHENLERLHQFKIDAILVIDSVALPDIDQLKLTSPLCKHSSIFIKKVRLSIQKSITNKDLLKSTIGVMKDSLFHLYALDNYYSFASIRPYETLESGILDIYSERIDILFAEEAFYDARISETSLAHRHSKFWLKKLHSRDIKLPGILMTLAIRSDDQLFNDINSAINSQGIESPCTDLFAAIAETKNRNPGDDYHAVDKD